MDSVTTAARVSAEGLVSLAEYARSLGFDDDSEIMVEILRLWTRALLTEMKVA